MAGFANHNGESTDLHNEYDFAPTEALRHTHIPMLYLSPTSLSPDNSSDGEPKVPKSQSARAAAPTVAISPKLAIKAVKSPPAHHDLGLGAGNVGVLSSQIIFLAIPSLTPTRNTTGHAPA